MSRLLQALIRGYQLVVSPMLGPRCRFYPSCSAYALEAVRRHGALRGCWLAGRRLLRCHPWNPGGVDFVPGDDRAATGAAEATDGASDSRTPGPVLQHSNVRDSQGV